MADEQTAPKTPRKPAARKAAPAKGPVSKPSTKPQAAAPLKAGATRKAATPKAGAKKAANGAAGKAWAAIPTDQIKEQAGKLQAQAGKAARAAAETGKVKTGEAMHGLAKLINDTAGTVDEKMGQQYGDYARYAAEAVSGAAKSLDAKDLEELATEARDFVRKSPAVAIGAAAVMGFVLMRLAKGSSDKA